VTQAAGGVDAATGAGTGAVDSATHVVSNAAPAPVTQAATGAVDTVTHQVTQPAASTVTDTVDTVANSVTQGPTSTAAPATQAAAPATDAATSSSGAGGGPGASAIQAAVDSTTSSVAAGPGQAFRDAAVTVTDGATAAAAHPGAAADPVLASSAAPSGPSASLVATDPTLAAPAATHGSVLHTVAEVSPAARVLVSAAIISSVVGASAAAGEKGGMRRLAFVNAQLIPCLLKASVQQHLETISTALSRTGGHAAATGGARSAGRGESSASPTRVQRLLDEVAQGFNDVVDGAVPDVVTEGGGRSALRDARLMTQIGMVFGLVYVGFLTLWFWATRRGEEEGV
jgi:hypothetical protein